MADFSFIKTATSPHTIACELTITFSGTRRVTIRPDYVRVESNTGRLYAEAEFAYSGGVADALPAQFRPRQQDGDIVKIWLGYAAPKNVMQLVFEGEIITADGVGSPPKSVRCVARSLSHRLTYKWGAVDPDSSTAADRVYQTTADPVPAEPVLDPEIQVPPITGVATDQTIVRNLVEAYGIPPSKHIIGGIGWLLGIIEPVVLRQGDTAANLIQQIDQLTGFRTFDAAGIVVRSQQFGRPGTSVSWTAEYGKDIVQANATTSLDGVYNRIAVSGLTYQGLTVRGFAEAVNPAIPDPPRYITLPISSTLIETDDRAGDIARVRLAELNREAVNISMQTLGNPALQPGQTITVNHPHLQNVPSSLNVFVQKVEHLYAGGSRTAYVTNIVTSGGQIDAPPQNLPPIALLLLTVYLEGEEQPDGTVTTLIDIIADGSGSTDPDTGQSFLTLTYVATAVGGTFRETGTTTQTITGTYDEVPVVSFLFEPTDPALWSVTVELTVTDAENGTDVATQTVDAQTDQRSEVVWSVEGSTVAVSIDGQQTWREQSFPGGSCECLNPFPAGNFKLFGGTNIYGSFDYLETAPVPLGKPTGATGNCTAIWVQEPIVTDGTEDGTYRVAAAFGNGIYAGVLNEAAQTLSWTTPAIVPTATSAYEVRESAFAAGEYRVTQTGNNTYLVHIPGSTTDATPAGVTTADVGGRMAAGFGENLFSYRYGSSGVAAPNNRGSVYSEESGQQQFQWGALNLTHEEYAVVGLSAGLERDEFYAITGSTAAQQRYWRSDAGSPRTFIEIAPAPAVPAIDTIVTRHLLRSGNIPDIVYGATTGGVTKSIRNDPRTLFFARRGTSYMVGYSNEYKAPVKAGFWIATDEGEPAATFGVWRYDGEWTRPPGNDTLPQGEIRQVAVSPFDRNHVAVVYGNDRVGTPTPSWAGDVWVTFDGFKTAPTKINSPWLVGWQPQSHGISDIEVAWCPVRGNNLLSAYYTRWDGVGSTTSPGNRMVFLTLQHDGTQITGEYARHDTIEFTRADNGQTLEAIARSDVVGGYPITGIQPVDGKPTYIIGCGTDSSGRQCYVRINADTGGTTTLLQTQSVDGAIRPAAGVNPETGDVTSAVAIVTNQSAVYYPSVTSAPPVTQGSGIGRAKMRLYCMTNERLDGTREQAWYGIHNDQTSTVGDGVYRVNVAGFPPNDPFKATEGTHFERIGTQGGLFAYEPTDPSGNFLTPNDKNYGAALHVTADGRAMAVRWFEQGSDIVAYYRTSSDPNYIAVPRSGLAGSVTFSQGRRLYNIIAAFVGDEE